MAAEQNWKSVEEKYSSTVVIRELQNINMSLLDIVTPPIFQDISIRRKHAGAYSSPKSRQTSSQGKGMSHGAPKCFLLPTPQCAKAQVSSLFGSASRSPYFLHPLLQVTHSFIPGNGIRVISLHSSVRALESPRVVPLEAISLWHLQGLTGFRSGAWGVLYRFPCSFAPNTYFMFESMAAAQVVKCTDVTLCFTCGFPTVTRSLNGQNLMLTSVLVQDQKPAAAAETQTYGSVRLRQCSAGLAKGSYDFPKGDFKVGRDTTLQNVHAVHACTERTAAAWLVLKITLKVLRKGCLLTELNTFLNDFRHGEHLPLG
ncbi:hypothetical protein Anapl_01402 [Anas platyrhynchos]|uniref:Uncharacterized protein n=1 Tax=Anas platyrhynchos TaxID=8839 RepID=R0K431_ANAPL|nr:hypothetical protein Anapl_01402 [Anas platyrhynchos]